MSLEEQLLVRKIDWGTVIDHIPNWRADQVLKLIEVESLIKEPDVSVIVLKSVPSRKYGKKDVIKLYHYFIKESDAALIKLLFPTVTINFIRDWKVQKYVPNLPEELVGKVRCPEVTCISNARREPVIRRFRVLKEEGYVECYYCDALLEISSIPDFIAE
ncbi:MAG: aspartate carbamoyltransferase regulatory subunit [Thaumarchaeota archaeon]|nr:aspartate carbamoyltransferase regulatory subunit [Candidatus Calditenuaceae archaeon]MDW8186481.1 aspartate carbamoyltransferase regulatory subunit [Nitrososphaerota archaeon]